MRAPRVSHRGFTLIEVLIASAITIASMGLLLQIFGSGLTRLNKIDLNANLIIAEKELLSRFSTVNPAQVSEGEGVVEGFSYRWSAHQIKPFKHVSEDLGEIINSRYIALYEVEIKLFKEGQRAHELKAIRIGWRSSP